MVSFFLAILPLLHALLASAEVHSDEKRCPCGFYDDRTEQLFTDSIIVYFNETSTLPDDLVAENYAQKYEKDWNAVNRQGASQENVIFEANKSVQLYVQPPTHDHLVYGAGLRTARRDIQHGSFRTLIKSPSQARQGSAMSMLWKYNETEVAELSVMNTNDPSTAWVGTFINNEFPERNLGMNYTQLQKENATNREYDTLDGGLNGGSIDPWQYTEYRIDWTAEYIKFYIGGNMTRKVLHQDNKALPSVPSALYFKHWSTGNRFSMQGPPDQPSAASIKWVRMFFNASSMTDEARQDFSTRCPLTEACSMDDIKLRGATPFTEAATKHWKQAKNKDVKRMPALWISIACLAFSSFLLIHTFVKRLAPKVLHKSTSPTAMPATSPEPASTTNETACHSERAESLSHDNRLSNGRRSDGSGKYSPDPHSSPSSRTPRERNSDDGLAIERIRSNNSGWAASASPFRAGHSLPNSSIDSHGPTPFDSRGPTPFDSRGPTPFDSRGPTPWNSNFNVTREELIVPMPRVDSQVTLASPACQAQHASKEKIAMDAVTELALGPAPRMHPSPPPARDRINHLAGLVVLCSLMVTVMHFGLTYVPAIIIPNSPSHKRSEYWAQKIIAPFLLNQMWLGVFFTTSVRFLTSSYFKRGNVEDIAKAAVRRTPRLMIPVASIALLEYFMIDIGTTSYLESLPSITWSTWPYVTRYRNFGQYISEILELAFLIPNAVPKITLHYCTGVLWTIAVQLQGSWLVLLGAIVVREIRSPAKRMAFYAFCLVSHWYAQSWGTYLWLGVLLTDLDVTYTYKAYLYKRPLMYYPVVTFFVLCIAAGFAANIVPNWAPTSLNFVTAEHNIHPDPDTAAALGATQNAGYPAYFVPRLNGLLFAAGTQGLVELSTSIQWLLSTPPFLVLFPHVFTIYLIHGLIFWSWGSWLMVLLSSRDIPYGINVTVVGVTSYVLLFLCLPVVTPVVEALGKDLTAIFWMTAQHKSPPRRPTLFPYPKDLFTGREGNGIESGGGGGASVERAQTDVEAGLGTKGKGEHTSMQSVGSAMEEGSVKKKLPEDGAEEA